MASRGSQISNIVELLGMGKKYVTSSLKLMLHIQHQCQENNVTLGASLSLVRGLDLISMSRYGVLSLLFELLILYFKTSNCHLCYFLGTL